MPDAGCRAYAGIGVGCRVSIPTPPIPLLAQVLPVLTQVRTLLLSELLPFRPLQVQIPLLPGLLPATFPVPMLPVRPLLAISNKLGDNFNTLIDPFRAQE